MFLVKRFLDETDSGDIATVDARVDLDVDDIDYEDGIDNNDNNHSKTNEDDYEDEDSITNDDENEN